MTTASTFAFLLTSSILFVCATAISSERHISKAFSRMRSSAEKSLFVTRWSKSPTTNLSPINETRIVPNAHVCANLRKSVTSFFNRFADFLISREELISFAGKIRLNEGCNISRISRARERICPFPLHNPI